MTDPRERLYTSADYKSAALDLMAREANWFADSLGLGEQVHPENQRDHSHVHSPSHAIGGTVCSATYRFDFLLGALRSIETLDRVGTMTALLQPANRAASATELLDSAGAHELARSWLKSLGVDLEQFEATFPPRAAQARGYSFFIINWGGPSGRPLHLRVSSAKQLIGLELNDPAILHRPPLVLENWRELQGPLPPHSHFVERKLGKRAFRIIQNSDRAEAWLLTSTADHPDRKKRERAGPVILSEEQKRAFAEAFLNFDSYRWFDTKMCMTDYGAHIRFEAAGESVDCYICYDCRFLGLPQEPAPHVHDLTPPAYNALIRAIQSVFPKDKTMRNLPLARE